MNFLETYEQAQESTEPPKNFHLWSALSLVSSLLGRKVYLPVGHFEIFPNLYICLVGLAGSRKSTAVDIAKPYLASIKGFPFGPDSFSREALLDAIEESKIHYTLQDKRLFYHQVSCMTDEFSQLIGQNHLNQAVIDIFTSLYSKKDFRYRTKNKGSNSFSCPYVNILTCCVPRWIKKKLKDDVISDGFTRRIILVYETHLENYVPWPVKDPSKKVLEEALMKRVQEMKVMKGVVRFTKEAKEMWDPLYIDIQKNIIKQHPKMQSYHGSKHALIWKLCIILSACLRDDLVVDSIILGTANKILTQTEKGAEELVTGIGRNEISVYKDEISYYITKKGSVSYPELLSQFSGDLKQQEFTEIMQILCDTKKVKLIGDSYKSLEKFNEKKKSNMFDLVRDYEPANEEPVGSTEAEFDRLQV